MALARLNRSKCFDLSGGIFLLPAMLCLFAPLLPGAKLVAPVGGVTLSVASIIGGGTASGTVTLSTVATAPGVTVTLSSDSTAATPTPGSVTIPSGQNSATFSVNTSSVSTSTVANIRATGSDGSYSLAALNVLPVPALVSISLTPSMIVGGNPTSSNTVTLSSPAPTGGLAVNLAGNQSTAATVPASATVAEGATVSTPFTITTNAVTSSTSVTLTATCASSKPTWLLT